MKRSVAFCERVARAQRLGETHLIAALPPLIPLPPKNKALNPLRLKQSSGILKSRQLS
jgi:hypothetical protein